MQEASCGAQKGGATRLRGGWTMALLLPNPVVFSSWTVIHRGYNMRSCCFETRPRIKEVSFIRLRIFIGHLPHVLINRIMVLDNVHVLFHWIHFTDEEAMVWG